MRTCTALMIGPHSYHSLLYSHCSGHLASSQVLSCTRPILSAGPLHLLFLCLDTEPPAIQVASWPFVSHHCSWVISWERASPTSPHHHHHLALLWLSSQQYSVYLAVVHLPNLECRLHDTWDSGCSIHCATPSLEPCSAWTHEMGAQQRMADEGGNDFWPWGDTMGCYPCFCHSFLKCSLQDLWNCVQPTLSDQDSYPIEIASGGEISTEVELVFGLRLSVFTTKNFTVGFTAPA